MKKGLNKAHPRLMKSHPTAGRRVKTSVEKTPRKPWLTDCLPLGLRGLTHESHNNYSNTRYITIYAIMQYRTNHMKIQVIVK